MSAIEYRRKSGNIIAVRWHGNLGKTDSFKEVEEAFGVSHRHGQIGKMLGGVIGVHDGIGKDGANVKPGQWLVRGVKEELIAMDDDLFQALFESAPKEEKA